MPGGAAHLHVRAKRGSFDLRGNQIAGNSLRIELGDDIEEQRLRHRKGRKISALAGDIGSTAQIDAK